MRSPMLFFAVLTVAAGADFSGTWKFDPERSRIESIPAPKDMVIRIAEEAGKVRMTMVSGKNTETLELPTDGAEQKVTIAGQPATASARKEDNHLVVTVTRETPEGPVTQSRRMRVSDSGKTMSTILTWKDKGGEKTGYGFYVKEQ